MSTLAKVAIVGRMNVGKSTLFNRLSVDVKSLTLDYEGVTRDFMSDVVSWQGISFELIDSGGISLKKMADPLAEQVRVLGISLVEQADLIVFVCDGTVGLTHEDRDIVRLLRKLSKEVILVVNKADNQRIQEYRYEFMRIGYDPLFISAQHGTGIADLLEAIVYAVKKKHVVHEEEKIAYKVVLLGKPNVGKSSLMNFLLERERSLVADIPGTTREAITEPIKFYKETIQLTDTPGVRRKRSVDETLESMMVKSSFRAVEQADIVLLMIDAHEAKLSDQELTLAFHAFEHHKAIILLINKSDLLDEQKQKDMEHDFEQYYHFLKKIPMLFISCKTGKNVGKILTLVHKVWQRHSQTLPPDELNLVCKQALAKTPLYHKTKQLMLYKAKQIKTAPVTIVLFVNESAWFGDSQRNFFENVIRNHFDLKGAAVRLLIRKN